MRIVYMGTPAFARAPLLALLEQGYEVAGVFTQPDRPSSRGMKVSFGPVKEIALANGIPVFQPGNVRDGEAANLLRELKPDLIVVVAYGKILPKEILEIPPLGCINIHASLLPKYRGAAPIQWAVLNGDSITGVTSMYLAEEMDTGDILLTKETAIGGDETSGELFERLEILGAQLLTETVKALQSGEIRPKPQDGKYATYTSMLSKEMSPIDWTDSAFNIKCKVRGLNPWPTATAQLRDTTYKIYSVQATDTEPSKPPGEVVATGDFGIEIACGDATVIIKELQAPGGKRMLAADHLKGNPF
ncbi:MAG: methionyl-tRNA formyltransferase [Oscillospiraceae bacterium]|nr:methionyl-tRNA formyltransferase [Oscillospiraceae bacterium]